MSLTFDHWNKLEDQTVFQLAKIFECNSVQIRLKSPKILLNRVRKIMIKEAKRREKGRKPVYNLKELIILERKLAELGIKTYSKRF